MLVAGFWTAGNGLAAQTPDTTSRPAVEPSSPPLRPLPAFFHSLLLPGWGQSKLDRKLTAALFITWEGVTLGMALKAGREVGFLQRIYPDSSERVIDKKKERQDWLILLAFNHLFSGLEAFVGSQLQDFPADVKLRAMPGGIGLRAAVAFRVP